MMSRGNTTLTRRNSTSWCGTRTPATPGDQPYILEFSAGNAGPDSETMDSPATGKNVIATGASENVPGTLAETYGLYADGPDTMADFSSRGPVRRRAHQAGFGGAGNLDCLGGIIGRPGRSRHRLDDD